MTFDQQFRFLFYNPIFLFIWGSCWGSFLNVVFYRYPLGKSVVRPGSACPNCKKTIAGYDNVPVFAWFWLRGKCRSCHNKISAKYPLFEALFGLIFVVPFFIHFGEMWAGLSLGFLFAALSATIMLLKNCGKAPWYLWTVLILATIAYGFQYFGRP